MSVALVIQHVPYYTVNCGMSDSTIFFHINPSNAELNPICHLLVLLGAHHILHVSGVSVKGHFNPLNAELNPICHFPALLGAHHIFDVSEIRVIS